MENKAIKTEIEYKKAVKELERIGDDPNFGEDESSILKFEELTKRIKQYEATHYFIEVGDPIEIIKLKMEYLGLKREDLIPYMGSKGVISEVFNKKRALSKTMIRNLSKLLKIDQNILNVELGAENMSVKKIIAPLKSTFKFEIEVRNRVNDFQHMVFNRKCLFNICSRV